MGDKASMSDLERIRDILSSLYGVAAAIGLTANCQADISTMKDVQVKIAMDELVKFLSIRFDGNGNIFVICGAVI